jgi:hypothetical protein
MAVFLFGVSAVLSGAFIRSCRSIPAELFEAWCGGPPQSFTLAQHQHCVGCALMAVGLGLIALSPILTSLRPCAAARAGSKW